MNQTESFAELLEESAKQLDFKRGEIIHAKVTDVNRHMVTVDANIPTSTIIPTSEFLEAPEKGSEVPIIIYSFDNGFGEASLSHANAVRELSRTVIAKALDEKTVVNAKVVGYTKSGLLINISGWDGFVPSSHVDLVRLDASEYEKLLHQTISVMPLSHDEQKNNYVASRKEALIFERGGRIEPLVGELNLGDKRPAQVKSVVPYGMFVDLGGRDCLVHISDLGWRGDASKLLTQYQPGDRIDGVLTKKDHQGRFCMSLKHSDMASWEAIKQELPAGTEIEMTVDKVDRRPNSLRVIGYHDGISVVVDREDIAWGRVHPSDVADNYPRGKTVKVVVTGHSDDLGWEGLKGSLKAAQDNPWLKHKELLKENTVVDAVVRSVHDSFAIAKLNDEIAGIIPFRELCNKDSNAVLAGMKHGDKLKVRIMKVDFESNSLALSLRQAQAKPASRAKHVLAEVTGFSEDGKVVKLAYVENDRIIEAESNARNALPTQMRGLALTECYTPGDKVKAVVIPTRGPVKQLNLRKHTAKQIANAFNGNDVDTSMGNVFGEELAKVKPAA